MNTLFHSASGAVLALTIVTLLAGSTSVEAQDQAATALHLYNRTCGAIEVVILDDGECPKGAETCRVSIDYGERGDIQMTGALPAALTYHVEGRCTSGRPTQISGQCEVTLVRLSPKHPTPMTPGNDTSSLERAMDVPCTNLSGECVELEGGSIRNKMVTLRHRTVDIELGLCDQGVDGVDICQPQCKVR